MLNYIKYIDQILSYDLSVTASFSDDGEFSDTLIKDTVPTRKDYEKLHSEDVNVFQRRRVVLDCLASRTMRLEDYAKSRMNKK